MDKANNFNKKALLILQELRDEALLATEEYAFYELHKSTIPDYPSVTEQIGIIADLYREGAILTLRRDGSLENATRVISLENKMGHKAKGIFFKPVSPLFDEAFEKFSTHTKKRISTNEDIYKIEIRDREIRVNDYLLCMPQAAKGRMAFIEYAYEHSGLDFSFSDMPKTVQDEIAKLKLSNILHGLGFKGEILKAFFPKRTKKLFHFRKEVKKSQLEKEGRNIRLLESELQTADSRYKSTSPE